MKSKTDIAEYLKQQIEEVTHGDVQAESIGDDAHLLTDLKLDSLDYATILLGAARWMDVTVQEHGVEWNKITSIAMMAAFLEQQQS